MHLVVNFLGFFIAIELNMRLTLVFSFFIQFLLCVNSYAGFNHEPTSLSFFKLVDKHKNLFEFLPITRSGMNKITILPHLDYPNADPGYLLETKNLLIGPLADCDQSVDIDFSAIYLHEYAHTVFTENFYLAFGLRGEDSIGKRYNPNQPTLSDKAGELAKVVTPRDLIQPFDEVFADVFAALALDNPSALQKTLISCGALDVARDFSTNYRPEGWTGGTLKPTLLPLFSNHYSGSPISTTGQSLLIEAKVHNVLSPFRSHIWSHYLKSHHLPFIKSKIIMWSYLVSIHVTQQLYNKKITYDEWFQISKEDLNLLAMREFDRLINSEHEIR